MYKITYDFKPDSDEAFICIEDQVGFVSIDYGFTRWTRGPSILLNYGSGVWMDILCSNIRDNLICASIELRPHKSCCNKQTPYGFLFFH